MKLHNNETFFGLTYQIWFYLLLNMMQNLEQVEECAIVPDILNVYKKITENNLEKVF